LANKELETIFIKNEISVSLLKTYSGMSNYQNFIQKHSDLFWSVSLSKKEQISETLLVETILNYGSLEDTKELLELLGTEKTALIFSENVNKTRNNYLPIVENYFRLYFNRHAPKYSF
jgi:hypothetical protein